MNKMMTGCIEFQVSPSKLFDGSGIATYAEIGGDDLGAY